MTVEELLALARTELREDFATLTDPAADIAPRLYAHSQNGLIARPIPRTMFASPERKRYLFHCAIPLLITMTKITLLGISTTVYERRFPIPVEQMTSVERETVLAGKDPRGWRPRSEWPSTEALVLVVLDRAGEQSWLADIERHSTRAPTLGEWRTYGPNVALRGMTDTISRTLRRQA